MLVRGKANLAALGLALVLGLSALLGGVAEGEARSPSVGNAPMGIAQAAPIPPVRARPPQRPPPIQPRSGVIGNSKDPKSQLPSIGSPNFRVPYAACRATCSSSCYNSTSCADLNVAECTAARQRCRMTCSSSCN